MSEITFLSQQIPASGGIPFFPSGAKAITKSDTDTFAIPVALYVGVTGNVVVTPANGVTDVTFTGVPAGAMLPVMVKAVKSTSTTASGFVAIY